MNTPRWASRRAWAHTSPATTPPPYLYILLLISRVKNYPWQYLVKAASILADLLLGYAVMKLASLKIRGTGSKLMILNMTMILPTVVFNGAYWGQCDANLLLAVPDGSVYGAEKAQRACMMFFGAALSFKRKRSFSCRCFCRYG